MKWRVQLSDIDIGNEEIRAVSGVLRSKWLTMGAVTGEFEAAFARYLGVKYAFAVANGTAALHIAHEALGINSRDEVICPSLTFVATANSIMYTGAKPVFADIASLDDLNISPDSILKKITSRTKAITVVHYGGYPCNMDAIIKIAKKHSLFIIEDAAHAPGSEYKNKKIGAIGDIGCFSFFSNKNMTTAEGGMVVTDNPGLAKKIRLLRSHGMTTLTLDRHKGHAFTYDVEALGYNYRIDEIRAAIGLVQLNKLDSNNELRGHLVRMYRSRLNNHEKIMAPFYKYSGKPSFHIFPVLLKDKALRPRFMDYLKKRGIQSSIHYPPIHLFDFYKRKFGYKEGVLPLTEEASKREVTLPLYPGMRLEDVRFVTEAITSFHKNA